MTQKLCVFELICSAVSADSVNVSHETKYCKKEALPSLV